MSLSTNTCILADVRSRQSVWTDWMAEATVGLADDDLVYATARVTPFGSYLVALAPVRTDEHTVCTDVTFTVTLTRLSADVSADDLRIELYDLIHDAIDGSAGDPERLIALYVGDAQVAKI